MTSRELIQSICVAEDHVVRGRDPEGGVLTIRDGAWAFCPWGQADRHVWKAVDGMDLQTVRTARHSSARSTE